MTKKNTLQNEAVKVVTDLLEKAGITYTEKVEDLPVDSKSESEVIGIIVGEPEPSDFFEVSDIIRSYYDSHPEKFREDFGEIYILDEEN